MLTESEAKLVAVARAMRATIVIVGTTILIVMAIVSRVHAQTSMYVGTAISAMAPILDDDVSPK